MRGRFTWTEEQIKKLIEAYRLNQGRRDGWLDRLASEIGHNKCSCCAKAKRLGLQTDRKRALVACMIAREPLPGRPNHGKGMPQWQDKLHPRGMLGKNHTLAVRIKISASHIGVPHPHSEQTRNNMAASAQRRLRENPESFGGGNRRGKGGRRSDLDDRYFRSSYEANYARFMNFSKIAWEYEAKTFWFDEIKRGTRSYTPDFFLPATNEYHEVKGWMDAKSITQLKRMALYYPAIKIVVVDGTFFKSANKQGLCRLIPGWECNHFAHRHSKEEV